MTLLNLVVLLVLSGPFAAALAPVIVAGIRRRRRVRVDRPKL